MKRKLKEELRSKTIAGLSEEIKKRQMEISQLAIQIMTAKVKNTTALKRKKDELAVAETILQEKKLHESASLSGKGDKK